MHLKSAPATLGENGKGIPLWPRNGPQGANYSNDYSPTPPSYYRVVTI